MEKLLEEAMRTNPLPFLRRKELNACWEWRIRTVVGGKCMRRGNNQRNTASEKSKKRIGFRTEGEAFT